MTILEDLQEPQLATYSHGDYLRLELATSTTTEVSNVSAPSI